MSALLGLACSRVFCYKGAFITEVVVGDNEPTDSALRRFRKGVMNSGLLPEVRRRRYFEDTQDIKKRKASTRFKKVVRPSPTDQSSVALGKPKEGKPLSMGRGAGAAGAAAPAATETAAASP